MMKSKRQSGFTLMEIMVASVIFVIVASALLSLFNYVLKINRRSEALRQASQDARNFVEFLVKEVRNGQIYYFVGNNGTTLDSSLGPCTPPGSIGSNTYSAQDNKVGLIGTDNAKECFYFGQDDGATYAGNGTFSAPSGHNYTLVLQKEGIPTPQSLNPPNLRIEKLMFVIRPLKDPYATVGGLAKTQPVVVIIIKFVVVLPTGEQVAINYQTAVSSNKYDIPNQ